MNNYNGYNGLVKYAGDGTCNVISTLCRHPKGPWLTPLSLAHEGATWVHYNPWRPHDAEGNIIGPEHQLLVDELEVRRREALRKEIRRAAYATGEVVENGHHTARQGYQPNTVGQTTVTVDGVEYEVRGNSMVGDAHFVVGGSGQLSARVKGSKCWTYIGW